MLEVVEGEGGEVGVREIGRRLRLSPTIVQRLVTSLARRGYVEKNSDTSRYRLGYRSMALGANGDHRDLHSFPTRRSSDLLDDLEHVEAALE